MHPELKIAMDMGIIMKTPRRRGVHFVALVQ